MWYPGINTDIGIIVFLAVVFFFVSGLYKVMERLLGEGPGCKVAEIILCGIVLFGLLKGCGLM